MSWKQIIKMNPRIEVIEKATRLYTDKKIKQIDKATCYLVEGDTGEYYVTVWDSDIEVACTCEYMRGQVHHDQDRWCSHALACVHTRRVNRMKYGRK